MKKQKGNSHEGITWSEMAKQNVQAKKVYWLENLAQHVQPMDQWIEFAWN